MAAHFPPPHEWRPAGPKDSRAPCPGLNTLANYGYLPHDGKNISFSQLSGAIRKVYGLTLPCALVLSTVALVRCGNLWKGTINLHDLAKHNKLEHDASLVHDDTPKGETYAPTHTNPKLLQEFVASSSDGSTLSQEDFVAWRMKRETTPLSSFLHKSALSESAILLEVFGGEDRKVPVRVIDQLVGQEHIPEGFTIFRPLSLIGSLRSINRLQSIWDSIVKSRSDKV